MLQFFNDIILDLRYWDCECDKDYIHENEKESCKNCGAFRDEQPNSRHNEVLIYEKEYSIRLTLKGNYEPFGLRIDNEILLSCELLNKLISMYKVTITNNNIYLEDKICSRTITT